MCNREALVTSRDVYDGNDFSNDEDRIGQIRRSRWQRLLPVWTTEG